jgi:osmoprotectant transport system ATP-binding protein
MLEPTTGAVFLDGQNVQTLDPIDLRRHVGYVIQDFGLMPHWTVEENVTLVPRLLGWPRKNQESRAFELLQQVALDPSVFAARQPQQLSGGQRQRVAIARALAANPGLLLFDEPFGALDPLTRHEMRKQFRQLQDRYEPASVFVTHDLLEALSIATRIALLNDGALELLVAPDEFVRADTPLARAFLDTLPAELRKGALQ